MIARIVRCFALVLLLFCGWVRLSAQTVSDSAWNRIMAMPDDTSKLNKLYLRTATLTVGARDMEALIAMWNAVLDLSQKMKDRPKVRKATAYIGKVYSTMGNMPRAIEWLSRGAALYKEDAQWAGEADCYSYLAVCYQYSGDLAKAVELSYQSIYLLEANKDQSRAIFDAYISQGANFRRLENYDKAEEMVRKALTIARQITDGTQDALLGVAYGNLGLLHQRRNQYREAIAVYEEVLKSPAIDIRNKANISINIAQNWIDLGQPEKGTPYLESALGIARSGTLIETGARAQLGLAQVALHAGRFPQAQAWIDSADARADAHDLSMLALDVADIQRDLYKKMGLKEKALEAENTYLTLRDSLYHHSELPAIADLAANFERERKYVEIAEIRKRQWLYISLAISGLLIAVLIAFALFQRYRLRQRLEKVQAAAALERQQLEAENYRQQAALKEAELRFAAERLQSNNKLLLNLHELLDQNAANPRRLRDDLTALITSIEREVSGQKQPETDPDETSSGEIDLMLPGFAHRLLARYPDLTHNDVRLCAYLRMGYLTKEIAAISNLEVRSVESARYRLRKKLGIEAGEDLVEVLKGV